MPAKWFECQDKTEYEISACLDKCRMESRCATLPFLRLIAFDRKYRGITPSMAGNDARLLYLKATVDYTIVPDSRVFAVLGVSAHHELSLYDFNVFSEEPLSDEQMAGIPDLLEYENGEYTLTDHKTWGSFRVMRALGYHQEDEIVMDDSGDPIRYKSGKRKGEIKTHKVTKQDPDRADLLAETYQVNKYRMFFNKQRFIPSKLQLSVYVRDGGTAIAYARGINKNLYLIPIPFMPDASVNSYYANLRDKVAHTFATDYAPKCGAWESWDGKRCDGWCEVKEACERMGE
jgi:hypothetical protein